MDNITIELLRKNEEKEWQRFVENGPNPVVFTMLEWRDILVDTYKFDPLYIVAKSKGRIINGLPLFLVKFPFLGKKIISIPHDGCFGGVVDGQRNDDSSRLLYQKAIEISNEKNVNYLEIRTTAPSELLKSLNFKEERPVYITELGLKNIKDNWNQVNKSVKRNIKFAKRFGLESILNNSEEELKIFYKLMSKIFREFGTPVYHFKFLKTIQNKLNNGKMALILIKKENKTIGGGLFLVGRNTVVYKWGACDSKYLKYKPYDLMVWSAIEFAIEKGKTGFNLGITAPSNAGLLDFKGRWGAKNEKLHFYYYPVKTGYPDISKYFSLYELPKKIWRKLPLSVTPLIGKYVHTWFC